MDTSSAVEEICNYTDVNIVRISYTWIINNYSLVCETLDKTLESPLFSSRVIDNVAWCLKVSPGDKEDNSSYASIFLAIKSDKPNARVPVKFKISIVNVIPEKTQVLETNVVFCSDKKDWGYRNAMKNEILINEANGFIIKDKLTIVCELRVTAGKVDKPVLSMKIAESVLSNDFGEMFERSAFSDVTLSVDGKEFFVHKGVLAARSPVFNAMFKNEMTEKTGNRVEIVDVDHEVMNELLYFIYTGKARQLKQIADRLFVAADKYALERLTQMCEQALCESEHICVENASEVLILADMHKADRLKSHALKFIQSHSADVMETAGWKKLETNHEHLIRDVLWALVKCTKSNVDPCHK